MFVIEVTFINILPILILMADENPFTGYHKYELPYQFRVSRFISEPDPFLDDLDPEKIKLLDDLWPDEEDLWAEDETPPDSPQKRSVPTPSEAKQILDENPNMFPEFAEYFRAIMNGTLPHYFLGQFEMYRSYSDDLPEPDIPNTDPDYRFLRLQFREHNPRMKCRLNVIRGIKLTIRTALNHGILEPSKELENYLGHKWEADKGAKGEYWTSREEINLINHTLDSLIAELKKS
jgi:hypothetical protein